MPLSSGSRLGPYEISGPLGAGGMGEVYRAHDSRLGRDVAIKVLPSHLSASPELRMRFEREARAISQLSHPHICTLYDVGRQDGIDYLVMEHLEGETLAQRLERGPLPPDEVLRRGIEIADALSKAHRQGVVHRDLKPGNVMLTKSGAKLLDFGLARALEPAAREPGSFAGALSQTPTLTRPLTGEGLIVGTFQYMAPEQLEGAEADARSDVWAFGATLYEMATGRKAFEGHSHASLIASILKEQPRPIAELLPLSPPGLEHVVERCLAKDPDDRWQSARDLVYELRWALEGGSRAGIPAPVAAGRRRRERITTIVAGVASLAALGLAAGWVVRRPSMPPVVRFEIRPEHTIQFQDAPRISPDGRVLACSATDSTGITRIWVRPLANTSAAPLPGTEGAGRPFWSPDSRSLAFFADGKLKRVDVSGGPVISLSEQASGSDGTWSRNGVILFDGGAGDPIRRASARGGPATSVVPPDTARHRAVGWPCFLPNGKDYLFLLIGEQNVLCAGRLGSSRYRELGPCDSRAEFAPGYVLFMRGGSLVAQRFDARALKLLGDPFPIADGVRIGANGNADFSVSGTGVLTYATGSTQGARLVWVDRSGHPMEVVEAATPLGNFLNPGLSPDGRRVALRVLDPRLRSRDVWTLDLTRGMTSRFTFDVGNENNPIWSSDGARLLYVSDGASGGLHVRNASGTGEDERLLAGDLTTIPTDWSRDGAYVLYDQQVATGKTQVFALPTAGDRKPFVVLQGPYDQGQARFSPDGRWIAYTSNEAGRPEVFVQSFPGRTGKWQISTTGGSDARWRSDGQELYYLSPDQRIMAVAVRTSPSFDPDAPRPLFTAEVLLPGVPGVTHYAVSADGQRFLLVVPESGQALAGTQTVLNWAVEPPRR